jgi:hypothetical protein
MFKVVAGIIIALVVILAAVAFAKDMQVYENGSVSTTVPLSTAWRD